MYLSPRVTSDSLRGLKRHITLMLHSAGSAILGQRRLRGAQLRRHPPLPLHRRLRGGSREPPLPPLPGSLRPPKQKGKGKGSFLAAAAASRSHFLPNMAAMAAPAAGKPRPSLAGQRRRRRRGGGVTSPTAAPGPAPSAGPCCAGAPTHGRQARPGSAPRAPYGAGAMPSPGWRDSRHPRV